MGDSAVRVYRGGVTPRTRLCLLTIQLLGLSGCGHPSYEAIPMGDSAVRLYPVGVQCIRFAHGAHYHRLRSYTYIYYAEAAFNLSMDFCRFASLVANEMRMWPGVPNELPGTNATPASSNFSARSLSVSQPSLACIPEKSGNT